MNGHLPRRLALNTATPSRTRTCEWMYRVFAQTRYTTCWPTVSQSTPQKSGTRASSPCPSHTHPQVATVTNSRVISGSTWTWASAAAAAAAAAASAAARMSAVQAAPTAASPRSTSNAKMIRKQLPGRYALLHHVQADDACQRLVSVMQHAYTRTSRTLVDARL